MVDIEEQEGVVFRTCVFSLDGKRETKYLNVIFPASFYTLLPPTPPMHLTSRTFIVMPTSTNRCRSRFTPAKNNVAPDELQAHTGMFASKTNDGYYQLGLETAELIRHAARGDDETDSSHLPEKKIVEEEKEKDEEKEKADKDVKQQDVETVSHEENSEELR
jgi:hypothetical protein